MNADGIKESLLSALPYLNAEDVDVKYNADAREARVVLTVEVATASPVSVANELSSPSFTAVLSDELGVKTVFR